MSLFSWTKMMTGAAILAGVAAGCSRTHDEHEYGAECNHDHAHETTAAGAGHKHSAECDYDSATPGVRAAFEVPESAQRLLGLSFVKPKRRPVTGTLRFPGRFEWMPGARRVYGVAVAGVVESRVRPPQTVQAGDVLFTVRSPEWIAKKGEVNETEAALALIEAETGVLRRRLAQLKATGTRNAELEQQLARKEV